MKKLFVFVFVSLFILISAYSQNVFVSSANDFDAHIVLDADIGLFTDIIKNKDEKALALLSDKQNVFVFFGTMTKPVIISDEPLEASALLMEGRWLSEDKIVLDNVKLVFNNDVFRDFIDNATGQKIVAFVTDPRWYEENSNLSLAFTVQSAKILN